MHHELSPQCAVSAHCIISIFISLLKRKIMSDSSHLCFITLLAWCKICSRNHLVTMATDIWTSFLLFKEWKQFIVKIVAWLLSSMWRCNHAHLKCRILWGCCTPAQVCYSIQHTGDIWRQCTREINKSTRNHYESLTFWRFHPLSRTLIFTLNMIYCTCLLWHGEPSHHWRL